MSEKTEKINAEKSLNKGEKDNTELPNPSKVLQRPPKTTAKTLKQLNSAIFAIAFTTQKILSDDTEHAKFYSNAFSVSTKLNKMLTLTISSKIPEQNHLDTKWYIE